MNNLYLIEILPWCDCNRKENGECLFKRKEDNIMKREIEREKICV